MSAVRSWWWNTKRKMLKENNALNCQVDPRCFNESYFIYPLVKIIFSPRWPSVFLPSRGVATLKQTTHIDLWLQADLNLLLTPSLMDMLCYNLITNLFVTWFLNSCWLRITDGWHGLFSPGRLNFCPSCRGPDADRCLLMISIITSCDLCGITCVWRWYWSSKTPGSRPRCSDSWPISMAEGKM